MNDPRPWTAAALIGALWGAMELSLGTVLHLGRIPFRGMVMAALGLVCLVTLRRLRGRPGVCLVAGMVAAFLKIFTLGGLYPGPLLGILAEATIVEVVFDTVGTRKSAAVLSGALVLALTPVQMTLMVWVVAGRETVVAAVGAAEDFLGWAGLGSWTGSTVLVAVIVAAAIFGVFAGGFAWAVSTGVRRRLVR